MLLCIELTNEILIIVQILFPININIGILIVQIEHKPRWPNYCIINFRRITMSSKLSSGNCLSCALGPIFFLTSWIGLPSLSFYCMHSKRDTIVKISKLRLAVAGMLMIFLFYRIAEYSIGIRKQNNAAFDELKMAKLIINLIYILRATIFMMISTYKIKTIYTAFLAVTSTLKYWDMMTFEQLLNYQVILNLRINSYKLVTLLLGILTATCIHMTYIYSDFGSYFIATIEKVICTSMECGIIFLYHVLIRITTLCFLAYQEGVKRLLNHSISEKKNISIMFTKDKKMKNKPLDEGLALYRRLHTILICNLQLINHFTRFAFTIWILTTVILIVISGFVDLIIGIGDAKDMTSNFLHDVIGLQLQLYLACYMFVYLSFEVEDLAVVVSLVNMHWFLLF